MNASNTHVMIDQQTTWTTNSNRTVPGTIMPTSPSPLFVSEILDIVFQYLEELDLRSLASSSKSSSLARCARTCKAWKEPALKLIWESLDSLLPLMKLFPQDAFAAGSKKQPELWGFKRSLRPRDWVAFAKYAPLVRHLSFREGKNVVSSALIALDVQRPAKYRLSPFLPNLVTLRWTATMNNTLTLCAVFASPSLKSIAISALGKEVLDPDPERNDATCGLLCTLVDICPGLTDIHLNIHKLWAVSDIVIPLNTLQELQTLILDIGTITPFILRGISVHPSLTKLHLDLGEINDSFLKYLVGNSPQPGEFPALQELSIAADMHIINKMLLLVLSNHLQRVAISTYSLVLPEELSLCLQHLGHISPHLLELRIMTSFEGNYDTLIKRLADNRHVLTMSELLPLTAFKQMETLSIQLGYPVSIDDTEVAILISALPIIKEFTLCPAAEWVPVSWKPSATLRCLEWIAGNAKSLRSLGLSVDATTIPLPVQVQDDIQMAVMTRDVNPRSPPTPPLTPGSSLVMNENMGLVQVQIPSLEALFVGVSPIAGSSAVDMIAWLSQTFPSLRMVRSSSLLSRSVMEETDGTTKRIWDEVARAFKQEGASSNLPRRGHVEVIELMDPGADMDMEMEMDTCPTAAAAYIRVSDGLDGEEYW